MRLIALQIAFSLNREVGSSKVSLCPAIPSIYKKGLSMLMRNLLILILAVPIFSTAEDQPMNSNQKFMDHMNRIIELSRQHQ